MPTCLHAYMPVGDWPRICIETKFAIQKAVITRVTLLKQFHFRPIEVRAFSAEMILTTLLLT